MTFVHPLLLGGLALIGIPLLIHLMMRQKPKRLPFPAFRFLVQKHRSNQTRLRPKMTSQPETAEKRNGVYAHLRMDQGGQDQPCHGLYGLV